MDKQWQDPMAQSIESSIRQQSGGRILGSGLGTASIQQAQKQRAESAAMASNQVRPRSEYDDAHETLLNYLEQVDRATSDLIEHLAVSGVMNMSEDKTSGPGYDPTPGYSAPKPNQLAAISERLQTIRNSLTTAKNRLVI